MKRIFKILGLSVVVAAILALVIAGTVSAAGNDPGTGAQTQNQGAECLCGECPCGDCACADCDAINHAYDHDYSYSSPGPHALQNGR
ncbi:MAG: hypothetical protein OEV57_04780 [Dehalococcoidia bacterium]|nr:hypothetical protein [Dehalococcoidia bacterium]MDH4367428.1 hypothetical protein [Dehalococcoidia bacterium]